MQILDFNIFFENDKENDGSSFPLRKFKSMIPLNRGSKRVLIHHQGNAFAHCVGNILAKFFQRKRTLMVEPNLEALGHTCRRKRNDVFRSAQIGRRTLVGREPVHIRAYDSVVDFVEKLTRRAGRKNVSVVFVLFENLIGKHTQKRIRILYAVEDVRFAHNLVDTRDYDVFDVRAYVAHRVVVHIERATRDVGFLREFAYGDVRHILLLNELLERLENSVFGFDDSFVDTAVFHFSLS